MYISSDLPKNNWKKSMMKKSEHGFFQLFYFLKNWISKTRISRKNLVGKMFLFSSFFQTYVHFFDIFGDHFLINLNRCKFSEWICNRWLKPMFYGDIFKLFFETAFFNVILPKLIFVHFFSVRAFRKCGAKIKKRLVS